MKRIFFLIFLLSISCVFAQNQEITLTPSRTGYSQGETVQIHILSSLDLISPLSTSNLKLIDNRSSSIPIAQGLTRISANEYYSYFDIPTVLKDGEYFFKILSVRYRKSDGTSALYTTSLPLIVRNTPYSLSMRPAIFFKTISRLEQPGFQLVLSNHGASDFVLTLSTDASFIKVPTAPQTLHVGESITPTITTLVVGKTETTFSGNVIINYDGSSYALPVTLKREEALQTQEKTPTPNTSAPVLSSVQEQQAQEQQASASLAFLTSLKEINRTLKKDQLLEGTLPFKNTGETSLHLLRFELTGTLPEVVSLSQTQLAQLDPGEIHELTLTFNKNKDLRKNYQGTLKITSKEGTSLELPIALVLQNKKEEQLAQEVLPTEVSSTVPPSSLSTRRWVIISIISVIILLGIGFYFIRKRKVV